MEDGNRRWNIDLIYDLFDEDTSVAILQVPICRFCKTDKLIWNDSPSGSFIVKSTYYIARAVLGKTCPPHASRRDIWHLIWSSKASPRVKHLIWKLI